MITHIRLSIKLLWFYHVALRGNALPRKPQAKERLRIDVFKIPHLLTHPCEVLGQNTSRGADSQQSDAFGGAPSCHACRGFLLSVDAAFFTECTCSSTGH